MVSLPAVLCWLQSAEWIMLFYVDVMHDVSSQVYTSVLSRVTGSVSIQPTSNVCLKSFFKTYLVSIKIDVCLQYVASQHFTNKVHVQTNYNGACVFFCTPKRKSICRNIWPTNILNEQPSHKNMRFTWGLSNLTCQEISHITLRFASHSSCISIFLFKFFDHQMFWADPPFCLNKNEVK